MGTESFICKFLLVVALLTVSIFAIAAEVQDQNKQSFEINQLNNPSKEITQEQIKNLLAKFVWAYETGNLDTFISLFTTDASTEDSHNRSQLRKEYETLFGSTDTRKLKLHNVHWKQDSDRSLWGDADFDLQVQRKIDGQIKSFTGALKIQVKKEREDIFINRFFHEYEAQQVQ